MSEPTVPDVRVLVVDDQASFRAVVADLVELTDGVVLAGLAADVADAMDQVRALRPELVLVDINLGMWSGIDLTREIVELDPTLVVILMSTYAIDDLPEGVADCGARGYLHKTALSPASLAGLAARGPVGGAP